MHVCMRVYDHACVCGFLRSKWRRQTHTDVSEKVLAIFKAVDDLDEREKEREIKGSE